MEYAVIILLVINTLLLLAVFGGIRMVISLQDSIAQVVIKGKIIH
jgi:hypothetical protein